MRTVTLYSYIRKLCDMPLTFYSLYSPDGGGGGGLIFQRQQASPRTSLRGSTCSLTWTLSLTLTPWASKENMNFTTHRTIIPQGPSWGALDASSGGQRSSETSTTLADLV